MSDKRININLAAYPDSDSDEKWDSLLGPNALALMRIEKSPLRDSELCMNCREGIIQFFVFRDHKRPELICHGTMCSNFNCSILYVGITTDEDGVRE